MYKLLESLRFELSGDCDKFYGEYSESDLKLWVHNGKEGLSLIVECEANGHDEHLIKGYQVKTADEVHHLLYNLNFIQEHFPKLYSRLGIISLCQFARKVGFKDVEIDAKRRFWSGSYRTEKGLELFIVQIGETIRAWSTYKGMKRTILSNSRISTIKELKAVLSNDVILQRHYPILARKINEYPVQEIL